jgi:thiol-disulfide isomerase/thioredoxin
MRSSSIREKLFRAALAALFTVAVAAAGGAESAPDPNSALPYVVKVHADWCGTCSALEPTWEKIEAEYQGQARLVVFDVTNKKAVEKSRAEAKLLGLTEVFDRYKGSTGTIAVLDAQGNPIAVMKGELDFTRYKEAIAQAQIS